MVSRSDLKFTSASKNYDRTFNVADGAATSAWRYLGINDAEDKFKFTDPNNPPNPITIGCHCQGSFNSPTLCTGTTRSTCTRCIDKSQGDFDVKVQLLGYNTSTKPGWESPAYYEQVLGRHGNLDAHFYQELYIQHRGLGRKNDAIDTMIKRIRIGGSGLAEGLRQPRPGPGLIATRELLGSDAGQRCGH